jgi:hypothetical protein
VTASSGLLRRAGLSSLSPKEKTHDYDYGQEKTTGSLEADASAKADMGRVQAYAWTKRRVDGHRNIHALVEAPTSAQLSSSGVPPEGGSPGSLR